MPIVQLLLLFFGAALAINAVPHLVSGLRGEAFFTPFGRSAEAPSGPVTNVLWGALNLVVGLLLIGPRMPRPGLNLGFAALVLGGLLMGLYLAQRFASLRK